MLLREQSKTYLVVGWHGMDLTIREAATGDFEFLRQMLWAAASVAPEMRAIGMDAALAVPEIARYVDGWGREGDFGVVAVDGSGLRIGAAWVRRFAVSAPGYGFVSPEIPELAIGVVSEMRGRGAGSAMLDALLTTARERGVEAISLAVNRTNPARLLYERKGFRQVASGDGDGITMVALLVMERGAAPGVA